MSRARLLLAALAVLALGLGGALLRGPLPGSAESEAPPPPPPPPPTAAAPPAPPKPRHPPRPLRGVHVPMALVHEPGRLQAYLALPGLNALEVDVKDEDGDVAFAPSAVPAARAIGAARSYYRAARVVEAAHARGVWLIGRVVAFQDPVLAERLPALALARGDGSLWRNDAGHAWASPYRRDAWRYVVDVAAAAARLGFDEIQFDYVRFPTDGDTAAIVYPGRTAGEPPRVIAAFLAYARRRLAPLGVRVSADVFGATAGGDIGVGQLPRLLAPHLDALSPMVYPSHFDAGSYGLADPNAAPGETVAASLAEFRRELRGSRTALVPWLQDFSLGAPYGSAQVQAQIDAARDAGADGFLLWNALGEYHAEVLAHAERTWVSR